MICQLLKQRWHDVYHRLGAKSSSIHVYYAKYTHACTVAIRHFDARLLLLYNLTLMFIMITFTPIEDQRLLQSALPVTINSTANVCLNYQQLTRRKAFLTLIQPSYLSCQLAFEQLWVDPIWAINHQVKVLFHCNLSSTCMQGMTILSLTCFVQLQ